MCESCLSLLNFVFLCLPLLTSAYLCLPLLTFVYLCLPLLTTAYLCLPLFTFAYLIPSCVLLVLLLVLIGPDRSSLGLAEPRNALLGSLSTFFEFAH